MEFTILTEAEFAALTPEALLELAKNYQGIIVTDKAEIETLKAVIEEQAASIAQLNTVIGTAKAATKIDINKKDAVPVIPVEAFEHNGKNYKWNRASFRLPGDTKKYSAAEATVDAAVLDRLLAIEGQSTLTEIE